MAGLSWEVRKTFFSSFLFRIGKSALLGISLSILLSTSFSLCHVKAGELERPHTPQALG